MTHYYYDSKANKFYGPLDRMPPKETGHKLSCKCIDCERYINVHLPAFNDYLQTAPSIPHTFTGHSRVVPEGEIEWRYETKVLSGWAKCEYRIYHRTHELDRRRVATQKITEGEAQPIGTFEYDIENGKVKYEPNPNCSLNASQPSLTAQPDKQYPGRECGLSELEWQMEQVIDQIRSKETTIDCMAPLFKFLQSQNTAQSDKHGGSDIEFLHIIKELPLESRFRVCVQMAFINLITELGYREDKVWSPEEDEILSKLCSLAQKEAKHLSEEVHKWIKDGSPSPQPEESLLGIATSMYESAKKLLEKLK